MVSRRVYRAEHLVAALVAVSCTFGHGLCAAQESSTGASSTGASSTRAGAADRVMLMPPSKDAKLRRFFPRVDDVQIQRVLDDPRTILYTEKEMPPAYQDWDGGLQGIHSVHYNISANGSEPFGNANREFPWGSAGGTHRCTNVSSFHFLWLPLDEAGRPLPVVWYQGPAGYQWLFPVGAVLGEVLMMDSPRDQRVTFEMRVRVREEGDWAADVFRPYRNGDELAARVQQLRPDWQEDKQLVRLVGHLQQPRALRRHTLSDQQPFGQPFVESMGIDLLPPLDDHALVLQLLTGIKFQSCIGATWREGTGGNWAFAPTTRSDFHIVPRDYDAGFIEVNRESCIRCHRTVGQHARDFDPARDWYGRVRGSDGIFSFHPFDPSCISWNGYFSGVQMRRELVQGGLLERHNRRRHAHATYHRAAGLKF